MIGRPPSSYVVVHRRPHSLNIFSSETNGPIKVKFHMEFLWDGGTEVCSNGLGHMTKMAVMPIHGKILNKSSSLEPKGRWPWILACIIGCSSTTKFAQMMTYFTARSFGLLCFCMGKKVKQWIFSGTIVVYDLKLATDDWSDKKFLLTSKPCPLELYAPCPGAIYMY